MSSSSNLPLRHEYLLLRTSPPSDVLKIRQALQESLTQSFGLTASDSQVDVLWVGQEEDKETYGRCVLRLASGPDASRIRAAIAASAAAPRMEIVRSSAFLPSLLATNDDLT
ncbi:hypothetical protein MIND_00978700 [Mycena indigotica]|uniref:Uncharacterized protein n=1 Tax=Mycena indigotica TaxID=2126181 RepID=A0A8H6SET0_9AGAR|nr:uncharacterized protein MIND_00978700 [Mycena indigotica]KAF7297450.1 hypothetical protein MIND_00978700 [Mycena indigotica]